MKLLDRYIIRQFCVNFAILLVVLLLLFIAVDLMVNLDEFLEAGRVRADRFGGVVLGTLYSIFDYYYPLAVLLYVFFSGLVIVAAMGFTFAHLHRQRELTAMLASGVSLYRVAMPVVVVGIAFNALALPAREFIIPAVAGKLLRSSGDVKHGSMQAFPVRFAADGNALLTAGRFHPDTNTLDDVIIRTRNEQKLPTQRISADAARWNDEKGGWRLENVTVERLAARGAGEAGGGVQQRGDYFYQSVLSPEVLVSRRASNYTNFMAIAKLQRLQRKLADNTRAVSADLQAQIVQALWSRFSLLVLNVLVLVMALPFFLRRSPVSMLGQAIKAAGLVLGVWGGGVVLLQTPTGVVSPVVAAWLPVVLCLPLAAILLQLIRT
jgi:lipopolysaccharide export system permease protein